MCAKHHQNHHFIQKAYAKKFADSDGNLKWIKYKSGEKGIFNINDFARNQPISEKLFYSLELEKRINILECDGITVINKIIKDAKYREKIKLSRKELITLKFYLLFAHSRTNKIRNDIKNKNGDIFFKKIIEKCEDNEKEIQEKIINQIMDEYEKCRSNNFILQLDIFNTLLTNMSIDGATNTHLLNIMYSRVNIIKFFNQKLFLNEAGMFIEYNKFLPGELLSFFPLSPNIGICLYCASKEREMELIPAEKSVIFNNDVSQYNHKIKYKNQYEIITQRQKYTDQYYFEKFVAPKYYDKDDLFIYNVLIENEKVLDFCNAMMLVHNEQHIVIFQDDQDIKDAEKMIEDNNIYRKY